MVKLTVKREHFAQLVVKGETYVEAYRQSFNTKMDRQAMGIAGHRLANLPDVAARIAELKAEIAERVIKEVSLDQAGLVKHLIEIATADPNEIMQYRRVNCRHCGGIDFNYQWRHRGEYVQAIDKWTEAEEAFHKRYPGKRFKDPKPSDAGGFGWKSNGDINPDCPECEGEGIQEPFFADTRKLTGAARRLYAGVKLTKNGVEILTHSQDGARKMLGEHYGMFKTVVDSKVTSQNTNVNVNASGEPLSREELLAVLKERGLPTDLFDKRK